MSRCLNVNELIGTHDVLFITLDTLRYDVAQECWMSGRIPNLAKLLPESGWERRHSPGSFTYAAHHAFFAGFLPTPVEPGAHARLFALRFPGSETVTENTCVLEGADIVSGFSRRGYHTICIGGVGFFNKLSPLGNVFPELFAESYWSPILGVTDPQSTQNQVGLAVERIKEVPADKRLFLFLNVSAIHQPNSLFLPGATEDSIASHAAALEYVDRELPPIISALRRRAPALVIICSDHGTAYGEDGFHGHRLAHSVVWDVPYAELLLSQETQ